MDEKTKLYVFAKKEVALLFIFMVLIGATAFTLGVKVGKTYSFKEAGFTEEDRIKVELTSPEEESINNIVKKAETEKSKPVDMNKMYDNIQESIKEQLAEEPKEPAVETPKENKPKVEMKEEVKAPAKVEAEKVSQATPSGKKKDRYSGKWTIQLGSHRSLADAEGFASGFKIRGYNPIVNEVEIPSRGTWFRVSIGTFSTISEAKEYLLKEKSLFQGNDYVIGRFD